MKRTTKLGITAAAVAMAATIGWSAVGQAAYPEQPITYYIPFGPGGESDVTARYQQPFFKQKFGQDFIVTYKPGGGGSVGWSQLNKMKGDGYTIMGTNLPHIVIQAMEQNVGFKTDDLTNVYFFHFTPDAIVVKEDSQFKTLKDLIDFAKANPGKVTFGGSGKGSANHLSQIIFDAKAGIKTTYVAFGGTGPSVTALLGGQIMGQWGYTTVPKQFERTRLLAVAMEQRHPAFPDVPTFKELGYDMIGGTYRGIGVPKSTPEDIRKKLADAIEAVNKDPAFIKKMLDGGYAMLDVKYGKQMDDFMAQMKDVYTKAAQQAGMVK